MRPSRAASQSDRHEPSGDAVIVLDADGRILATNAATVALFGERILNDEADLIARLDVPAPRLLAPEGTEGEPVRLRHATHERWVQLSVHAVGDLGLARPVRIVIARDVTAQREVRRLREAFASVVSHELRTPVTTIYGGAQLLAQPSVSEQTRADAAAATAMEAERLYRLVDDLVILARFDQPLAIANEPVLLQRFVPALVDQERARGDASVIAQVPESLPAVAGRQGYVEQVLRHLLIAAIRFSAREGVVRVTAERTDGEVEVAVADSGPAISAEEARTMFDLFQRSGRTLTDASGANIGFYVCRRLIEAMGGTIWARQRRHGAALGFRLRVALDED